jgi:hypothetical protein
MIKEYEMVPYRRLICAVIIQAVNDYQIHLKQDGIELAAASRVGRWFAMEKPDGHGNFPHLCELLDLDPERLRSRLNTRDLVKEMRAYQAAMDARFARYRAMVDGGVTALAE